MGSTQPPNFSWIVPNKLAGLAMPRSPSHYQFLLDNDIRHLVSLSEWSPPHCDTCPGVKLHRIKIDDFYAPSMDQIKRFLSIVEDANSKGEGVGVHCLLGHGRTGTMMACYLVNERKITGVEAINEIRRIRPGSIESYEQEKAVVQFYHHIK